MKEQKQKVTTLRTKSSNESPNIDYELVKKQLNEGNMIVSTPLPKTNQTGPTKTQINRLKKFYNTTRWLPNSAFTTFFGKPAFENYGYGNVNPVYGGLFYGNYMLSHNMNPIDGANHPPEKQVYSSAMMKSLQRKGIRKPSPPRKVPDEIRNTPEELQEIRTRSQIFQLPNPLPGREIVPPNLIKAQYFRSGRASPNDSEEENEDEYEDFNVQNVLSGKKNKKKKIKKRPSKVNPYKQGKVKSEKEIEFERQRDYYMKMLGEDGVKNLEDLTEIKTPEEQQRINEEEQKIKMEEEEKRKFLEEQERQQMMLNQNYNNQNNNIPNLCPYCHNKTNSSQFNTMEGTLKTLKKKENPALLPPNQNDFMGTFSNPNFVCCMHHNQGPFNVEDQDPRAFQNMPPCMLNNIVPAGKPTTKNIPLNLFSNNII